MKLYVLDTDHVTLYQRDHPAVVERITAARSAELSDLAVALITVEEQLRGWLKAIRRASSGDRLLFAYSGLRGALEYFGRLQILDFNRQALDQFNRLSQEKIRIGTRDLRIAATVLAVGGTLVTRNRRDFSQVPGLALADWSI